MSEVIKVCQVVLKNVTVAMFSASLFTQNCSSYKGSRVHARTHTHTHTHTQTHTPLLKLAH